MTENEFLDHMVDVSRDPLLNEDPGPVEPPLGSEDAYRKGWVDALKAARKAVAYLQEDTFYILTEDALDVIDALVMERSEMNRNDHADMGTNGGVAGQERADIGTSVPV